MSGGGWDGHCPECGHDVLPLIRADKAYRLRVRREAAWDVPCGTCDAEPGEVCVDRNGDEMGHAHKGRAREGERLAVARGDLVMRP